MSENVPATQETRSAVAPIDNGKPALYNPAAFAQIWRASQMFAASDLVPTAYKNKPENCFIAIEMADRMGISPFAMLQSLVIINGKPSMEAKLIIALVNDSGIFADPLEYEIVGNDPHAMDYKVRVFAKMRKTGKDCFGPWITYQMVKGEGWLDKSGSKWKTMPSIMFMYRAASFFAKAYCPNITMGMQTREEMEDVKPIDITPEKKIAPALVEALQIAKDTAPALAAPLEETAAEIIDVETGEMTESVEQQPVETPAAKRNRRTKAEFESDKLAAGPPASVTAPPTEDGFPNPHGTVDESPHPAYEPAVIEAAPTTADDQAAGSDDCDLF